MGALKLRGRKEGKGGEVEEKEEKKAILGINGVRTMDVKSIFF